MGIKFHAVFIKRSSAACCGRCGFGRSACVQLVRRTVRNIRANLMFLQRIVRSLNMKTTNFKKGMSLFSILALTSTAVLAGHDNDYARETYGDYARVSSVTPEYERVNNPRQECSSEYIPGTVYRNEQADSGRSYTGTIVGGIAGALLGSRLGKGNGNRAATAAGAIAGAVIGDQIQESGRAARSGAVYVEHGREVQRCRVVEHWDNRLIGYRVVYQYAGRSYSALLPQDPGRRIPVRVSVTPAL